MKTVLKVILAVGLLAALTSCELFGSKPELAVPAQLTITAKGEAMTISWAAVADATGYDLYFTDDGTSPNFNSTAIPNVTSPYSHLDLDETKTYKYLLRARADGFTSSTSPLSEGYRPLPMMHVTITAAGYANQPLLLVMLDVPYNPDTVALNVGEEINFTEIVTGTTDSDGVCVLSGTRSYTTYTGFTIVKDLDNDGSMSTGDTVWGDGGPGSYGYLFWKSYPENSYTITNNWDTDYAKGSHTY